MRKQFFDDLEKLMTENQDVYFVCGDLGFGLADRIRDNFPDRFINSGAAECAMMGIGIGLALQGKVAFVYSITPFLLFRPFEGIRNYLHFEGIPVILVGSGRGSDYGGQGFSHFCGDDYLIDRFNIPILYEYKSLQNVIDMKTPAYINLTR